MSNKYEKFDNEFGLLPAEHENVNISKQKNNELRSGRIIDHYSDDKCAVEIITNCNGGKKYLTNNQTTSTNQQFKNLNKINEFDPDNIPKLSFNRRKWRFHLEQLWFRILSILIITTYCILTFYLVLIASKDDFRSRIHEFISFHIIDIFLSLITFYFVFEINLRIYASGSIADFFTNWYNSLDFVIIMIDFLLLISNIILYFPPSISLVCFGRFVRVYVLINLIKNNEKSVLFKPTADDQTITKDQDIEIDKKEDIDLSTNNIPTSTQLANNNSTTASKVKRLITPEDFKLDLIYIKDNIMIIQCPIDNLLKFKRNQVQNLEKFLDTKYGLNCYKVYNLCSEQTYMDKSKSKFFHGNYLNFPIEDYGIISLNMIKEFVTNLDTYLQSDPKFVAVIHCSDGKKRTSLVVCAWLLFKKYFNRLEDAQRFFYEQLNDKTPMLEIQNFNLLQTPSQLRYLKYFEQFVNSDLQSPPKRSLHLNEIHINSLINIGKGNGSDLYCVIQINQFEQFHMNFFQENSSNQFNTNLNCKTNYNSEQDMLTVCPINCPPLAGDITIKFFCRSKSIPKPHQHCAFYFSFNIDYLDETQTSSLRFDRTQLDNPHETQLHTIYRERFAIELFFKK